MRPRGEAHLGAGRVGAGAERGSARHASSSSSSSSWQQERRRTRLGCLLLVATGATATRLLYVCTPILPATQAFAFAPGVSVRYNGKSLYKRRRRCKGAKGALLLGSNSEPERSLDGDYDLTIDQQPFTATRSIATSQGGALVVGVNGFISVGDTAAGSDTVPVLTQAFQPVLSATSLDESNEEGRPWLITTDKRVDASIGAKAKPPTPRTPNNSRRFVRRKFRSSVSDLLQAALVGVVAGVSVAIFKLSIEAVREVSYQQDVLASAEWLRAVIPAMGGLAVGLLLLLDKNRSFPPGLRGVVKIVDDDDSTQKDWRAQIMTQIGAVRKSVAAVFTLGSGCSLGPEGPCVEIGMSIARACKDVVGGGKARSRAGGNWNLILLSCGAAAGVAAGFNAPIAGVFFALEVVQSAWVSIREERRNTVAVTDPSDDTSIQGDKDGQPALTGGLMSSTSTIAPVLLASIISALIARTLLGNHLVLVLTEYSLKTPLLELPLYLGLGAVSGAIAFVFSQLAKLSNAFFAGKVGPTPVQEWMHSLPQPVKPVLGGILCGVVGIYFPQILFFGYETLNALLANNGLSTSLVLSLLLVKMVMTALSAGSGLVGGTFAPSLFLGAMTGAAFHNIMSSVVVLAAQVGIFQGVSPELADIPAYAMVGAASVLAALFRAPLTASLLLFELTRDYDVILPLMASAGVASLVGDIQDDKLEQSGLHLVPRDQDQVSWGDLADKEEE